MSGLPLLDELDRTEAALDELIAACEDWERELDMAGISDDAPLPIRDAWHGREWE
jgi:hypothetical protein